MAGDDFVRRRSSGADQPFEQSGRAADLPSDYGMNGPVEMAEIGPSQIMHGLFRDDSLHRALSGADDVIHRTASTRSQLRRSMTTSAMVMTQDSSAHYRATASGGLESLDYDEAENETITKRLYLSDSERRSLRQREAAIMWAMVVTIGFLVGSIAYGSTVAVSSIVSWKFELVDAALRRGAVVEGWLILSAFVIVLSVIAVSLTRWAPEAAGSGIPHVKAYLNGNRLDGALRPRTLVAKVLGIICCVAIGMPAGREGPMVHTGAIVANLIGTGRSRWLNDIFKTNFSNDFVRRNFVSMGAASGVAAAFHAPIGGILFALEEVSSFWDPHLTVYTFFMVTSAAYTVALWSGGFLGTFGDVALVMWHTRSPDHASSYHVEGRSPYQIWEVFIFALLAVVCGLVGAGFNEINCRITIHRKRLLTGRNTARMLEAVLSIWLVLTIYYFVPFAMPCRTIGASTEGSPNATLFHGHAVGNVHAIYLVGWQCEQPMNATIDTATIDTGHGSHRRVLASSSAPTITSYNGLATLLMSPQETAIKQLFSRGTVGYFSIPTLAIFFVVYFVTAVFVYGVAVPSGLFVPNMLIGGGLGRLVGELVHSMGGLGAYSDPGIYALVGAAGVLGGVTRMTMSLAVIILELTNDIDLLLPIMLSIGISKQVGDMFNRGLYDIHIGLNKIPMLEDVHGETFDDLDLHAHSIMCRSIVTIGEMVPHSCLKEIIESNSHHGFPVTSSNEPAGSPNSGRVFAGIISRQRIVELLDSTSAGSSGGKPNPDDPEAGADNGLINLRPYCDPSPYTVCETLPLRRVFRLFTAMGLRHLVVVDSHSLVVGMITRKDFLKAADAARTGQVPRTQRTQPPLAAVAQRTTGLGDEKLNDDHRRDGRSV